MKQRHLPSPRNVRAIPLDTAREKLGPLAGALAVDQHIGSRETHGKLGWWPARTIHGVVPSGVFFRAGPAAGSVRLSVTREDP
jgi:hypothetical protein